MIYDFAKTQHSLKKSLTQGILKICVRGTFLSKELPNKDKLISN